MKCGEKKNKWYEYPISNAWDKNKQNPPFTRHLHGLLPIEILFFWQSKAALILLVSLSFLNTQTDSKKF